MNPRLRSLLSSMLFVAACAVAPVLGQARSTQPIDNFDDGNDDGWVDKLNTAGLLDPRITANFDAGSGSYVISTSTVPDLSGLPVPCVGAGAGWSPSRGGAKNDHAYSNGTVRAKFTLNNDLSGGFITLRGDSSEISTLSFYDFLASANRDEENPGFIGIDLLLDGADTTPTPGDTLARAPFDLVTGNEYIMEATAVGPHLSLKAWAVGDEEPDQPQVSVIDHTLTSGKISLASYYCPTDGGGDILSTTWDDITFTPGNAAFAAHASSMATVPEPSTVSLVALSLVGVFGLRRRRLLG